MSEGEATRVAAEFSSRRAVDDLETLRKTVGADRLDLVGASYGAALFWLYAQEYPSRVGHLILDSPLLPELSGNRMISDRLAVLQKAVNRLRERGIVPSPSRNPSVQDDARLFAMAMSGGMPNPLAPVDGSLADVTIEPAPSEYFKSVACFDHLIPQATADSKHVEESIVHVAPDFVRLGERWSKLDTCRGYPIGPVLFLRPLKTRRVLFLSSQQDSVTPTVWTSILYSRVGSGRVYLVEGTQHGLFGVESCATSLSIAWLMDNVGQFSCQSRRAPIDRSRAVGSGQSRG